MRDWIKEGIFDLLGSYKKDIEMIWKKKQDIEWKRDHYRYSTAVTFQRILEVLETQLTNTSPAQVKESTRKELIVLRNKLDHLIQLSQ